MTDKELKEIREKISCPELGDKHYGEWGILTKYQRLTIKKMLDEIDSREIVIKRLYKRIEELGETIADLEREIERLEADNCD